MISRFPRTSLSDGEKQTYIEAELCLMNMPSMSDLRGSRTKFDDFQAIHVLQADIAHFVVQEPGSHPIFLPFCISPLSVVWESRVQSQRSSLASRFEAVALK